MGHFIFERKVLYDLAGSLIDGRLFTQMGRLLSKKRPVFLIEGLPGVGVKRARQLLAHFGNVRAVIQASIEELQEVDGIGKQIAQTIYEILS